MYVYIIFAHTMEYYLSIKRKKFCHFSNVDGPRKYYI